MHAFVLAVISWLGDALDGSIARERMRKGFQDDRDLGAWLDPLVDKAVWVSNCLFCPWRGDFSQVQDLFFWMGISSMGSLIVLECFLAYSRTSDFIQKRKGNFVELNLQAAGVGKAKMLFAAVGVCALLFAMDDPDLVWPFHVWSLSMTTAVPLGFGSWLQKKRARLALTTTT